MATEWRGYTARDVANLMGVEVVENKLRETVTIPITERVTLVFHRDLRNFYGRLYYAMDAVLVVDGTRYPLAEMPYPLSAVSDFVIALGGRLPAVPRETKEG